MHTYVLHINCAQNSYIELNSYVHVFESRALQKSGHETSALMREITALIKGALKTWLSLPPCESSQKVLYMRKWPSPDIESAVTLILTFSSSRTMRNKILLFINYPVHGILLQQPERTETLKEVLKGLSTELRSKAMHTCIKTPHATP